MYLLEIKFNDRIEIAFFSIHMLHVETKRVVLQLSKQLLAQKSNLLTRSKYFLPIHSSMSLPKYGFLYRLGLMDFNKLCGIIIKEMLYYYLYLGVRFFFFKLREWWNWKTAFKKKFLVFWRKISYSEYLSF